MKAQTYLNALVKASHDISFCVATRQDRHLGIEVQKDVYALYYQKRNRQSAKFQAKLENLLKEQANYKAWYEIVQPGAMRLNMLLGDTQTLGIHLGKPITQAAADEIELLRRLASHLLPMC